MNIKQLTYWYLIDIHFETSFCYSIKEGEINDK